MSVKERLRLDTLNRVKRGEISVSKAAELLGVSRRQGFRLWKSFQDEGDGGLVHGLRGRKSQAANRTLSKVRDQAVALCREKYADFGAALASEYLSKDHGLTVNRVTLWRWLSEAKLGGRTRRASRRCVWQGSAISSQPTGSWRRSSQRSSTSSSCVKRRVLRMCIAVRPVKQNLPMCCVFRWTGWWVWTGA